GEVDAPGGGERAENRDEGLVGDALERELGAGERGIAVAAAHRRERADPAVDRGDGTDDRRHRRSVVDDVESDRRGLEGVSPGHQPSEPRPAAPGRRSLTDIASGSIPPVGSCSSNGSARASNASRVADGSEVVSMSAPSVSSATPTMPVMLTPRSP